ncbi:MAG: HD domain-containing protein [Patescibacteria group bacterium]|nr:HD domain-containing protein [Patescibacteria group bacterium]
MNQYFKLLKKYSTTKKHYEIILNHSLLVLSKSIDIIAKKELCNDIDFDLVVSGSLLHDIGACRFMENFDKPQKDYLKHGIIGGEILRREDLNEEALIAERHIGSGLSKKYIEENNLPLPHRDFLPITLEQKLVCYADKFHSKSDKKDNLKSIKKEMEGFGKEPFGRFLELEKLFG